MGPQMIQRKPSVIFGDGEPVRITAPPCEPSICVRPTVLGSGMSGASASAEQAEML